MCVKTKVRAAPLPPRSCARARRVAVRCVVISPRLRARQDMWLLIDRHYSVERVKEMELVCNGPQRCALWRRGDGRDAGSSDGCRTKTPPSCTVRTRAPHKQCRRVHVPRLRMSACSQSSSKRSARKVFTSVAPEQDRLSRTAAELHPAARHTKQKRAHKTQPREAERLTSPCGALTWGLRRSACMGSCSRECSRAPPRLHAAAAASCACSAPGSRGCTRACSAA